MALIITNSGNCNFKYVTGLDGRQDDIPAAMLELLTWPKDYYSKPTDKPKFRKPDCGMYLFAQGSDVKTETAPYGPRFKQFIEDNQLGEVTAHVAQNPLHNGRTGILYVWIINQAAIAKWWQAQQKGQ